MRYNRGLTGMDSGVRFVAAISWAVLLAGCGARGDAPVLLFNGAGTSPNDVRAIESILRGERLDYARVSSAQLIGMSEDELRRHRLLIVPGGNFEAMGKGLAAGTAGRVRGAVEGGLNYLGVCAGAFLAGNAPYNGLNLTGGVRFGFYSAEARGIRKAAVAISGADGEKLEQYWEDGPQLDGWGAVVARYPDGTAAVVQGAVGQGWVVLSGVHPEAPAGWRRGMAFTTPAEQANAYAARLIRAALHRETLPHF